MNEETLGRGKKTERNIKIIIHQVPKSQFFLREGKFFGGLWKGNTQLNMTQSEWMFTFSKFKQKQCFPSLQPILTGCCVHKYKKHCEHASIKIESVPLLVNIEILQIFKETLLLVCKLNSVLYSVCLPFLTYETKVKDKRKDSWHRGQIVRKRPFLLINYLMYQL